MMEMIDIPDRNSNNSTNSNNNNTNYNHSDPKDPTETENIEDDHHNYFGDRVGMNPFEMDDDQQEEEEDEEEGRSLLLQFGSDHNYIYNYNYTDSDPDRSSRLGPFRRKRNRPNSSKTNNNNNNCNLWQRHWMGQDSDEPWMILKWFHHGNNDDSDSDDGGSSSSILVLDATTLKFFKFVMMATGCLLVVHAYVWTVHDKRDVSYGIHEMVLYDSNLIILDWTVLFVMGRMYQQAAVDTLEFVLPVLISAILQSVLATHVSSLQHSVTPAEVACEWTWQMWVLVLLGVIPLILLIGGAHVWTAYRRGMAIQKTIELMATFVVFLAPYMGSAFFHLHHWYYGWLVALHCNVDTWWSRLSRNVFFGVYVNGVAIFGRDPIMTCALSLYQSQNQGCVYIAEYVNYTLPQLAHDSGMDVIAAEGGCDAATQTT
ncbi:hypothetical protein IV203_019182 [Nitzschia inconspicua]|uniref:Uncharacterized protein n=1 Tax=Nitzschia inconspicua TaxID=303405 RepID=A0A9K3LYQ1_9STRA|nr:hypothetical protein IV203_019182 [Nitzschia inconspicua]